MSKQRCACTFRGAGGRERKIVRGGVAVENWFSLLIVLLLLFLRWLAEWLLCSRPWRHKHATYLEYLPVLRWNWKLIEWREWISESQIASGSIYEMGCISSRTVDLWIVYSKWCLTMILKSWCASHFCVIKLSPQWQLTYVLSSFQMRGTFLSQETAASSSRSNCPCVVCTRQRRVSGSLTSSKLTWYVAFSL